MQTSTTVRAKATTGKIDAMWNLAGSLVYAGCQWLVLVATVKFSSVADVGRLSLAFAMTAPIFMLLHLRLRAASATDATLIYTDKQYTLLRLGCTALAVAITLVLGVAVHLTHEQLIIVIWVAMAKAVESGSDLVYGLLQQRHNLRVVALSMAARGFFSVIAFCYLLRTTHQLSAALAGLFGAWLLVFLAVDLPLAARSARMQEVRITDATSSILKLAWLTFPLGLSTMFTSLSANMPRYFIQHSLGVAALGVFSASAYLTMTGSVVISAIAESSIARMAQYFAGGQVAAAWHILRRVRMLTFVLSGALIAITAVAGRPILAHLYRAEYAGSATLLVVMMVAAGAANLASVYGYALIAARRFKAYLGCLVLSSVATAIACAVAIPRWSTMGAAAACLIGYALQFSISRAVLNEGLRTACQIQTPALSFPTAVSALKS